LLKIWEEMGVGEGRWTEMMPEGVMLAAGGEEKEEEEEEGRGEEIQETGWRGRWLRMLIPGRRIG